jgi:hypothetical protein
MSTSKVREAMLAMGNTIKSSYLTVYMYSQAILHKDIVLTTVEGSNNCFRALAIDAYTNRWVADYLAQAVDYTNIVVQGIPNTFNALSYTDVRNKLRHLRYALQVLIYAHKSVQVFDRARFKVYSAAISCNKYIDHELHSKLLIQSSETLSDITELRIMMERFITRYHNKLQELKDAHRNSK